MSPPFFMSRAYFCAAVAALISITRAFSAEPKVVTGITEPFFDVTLSSTVLGTIRAAKFKEGAEVKEGDVILELDSKLEELETGRKQFVMEHSKADYDATKTLFEKTKSVSKDEMDKRATEYHVAVAEHDIAEEQLHRRKIVAPFSGTIVEIFLQPGASCEPYKPLVRMVDTKRCYFIGHIEGTAASGLKLGQSVKIEVIGSKTPVEGKLVLIAPVVDSASGLARVKAIFDNADGATLAGLAGKMTIE